MKRCIRPGCDRPRYIDIKRPLRRRVSWLVCIRHLPPRSAT